MRPVTPLHLAVFEVPRPGGYDVRLRVVFADGRQGESKTHFEFRDWFIVSIEIRYPRARGNPDENGTLAVAGGPSAGSPAQRCFSTRWAGRRT
jgi:hypothetical protein